MSQLTATVALLTLTGNQVSAPISIPNLFPKQLWAVLAAGGVGGNLLIEASPDGLNWLPLTATPLVVSAAAPVDVTATSYDTASLFRFTSSGMQPADTVSITVTGVM